MFFRQYDLACLSLYSYLIGDTDAPAGRSWSTRSATSSEYLADAADHGLRIERVIETHFHADFLSGHLELAEATGAVISYGDVAETDFPIEPLADGQVLVARRGHARDPPHPGPHPRVDLDRRAPAPRRRAVGGADRRHAVHRRRRPARPADVGRAAPPTTSPATCTARCTTKLLTLPDATLVYPAHGAGSACGKHLSTAASSTIGEQRATNYALGTDERRRVRRRGDRGPDASPRCTSRSPPTPTATSTTCSTTSEPPAALDLDERARQRPGPAPCSSTPGRPSRSRPATCGARSTSASTGGSPSTPATSCGPGSRSCCSATPGARPEAKVRLARIGFDAVVGAVDDVEAALAARPELAERRPPSARPRAGRLAGRRRRRAGGRRAQPRRGRRVGHAARSARRCPLPQLLDHLDRARPRRADRRLLRRRLPLVDRRVHAARPRVLDGRRPHRRLRRLDDRGGRVVGRIGRLTASRRGESGPADAAAEVH